MNKYCPSCKNTHSSELFYKAKFRKDGLRSVCKECEKHRKLKKKKAVLPILDLENEIWKDVVGWEGLYKISNLGRVKSLEWECPHPSGGMRLKRGKLLSPNPTSADYPSVSFSRQNVKTCATIHRMLAESFIPNPDNKPQVNHINSIRTDYRLENLEWVTSSENITHGIKKVKTSKYTGVCWNKQISKWVVFLYFKGIRIYGGYFFDEEEASVMYKKLYDERSMGNKYAELFNNTF